MNLKNKRRRDGTFSRDNQIPVDFQATFKRSLSEESVPKRELFAMCSNSGYSQEMEERNVVERR